MADQYLKTDLLPERHPTIVFAELLDLITRSGSLPALFLALQDATNQILDTTGLLFYFVDGIGAVRYHGKDAPQSCERPRSGIIGTAFKSLSVQMTENVQEDENFEPEVDSVDGSSRTKSMIVVPCLGHSSVLAVFAAVNKVNGPFEAQDLAFGIQIGRAVSAKIEALRAVAQLEAQADLQKRIWEASLLLMCSNSLAQVCSRAGLVAAKLLKCESAHLLIVDEEGSDEERAVLRGFARPFKRRFLAQGVLLRCYLAAQIIKVTSPAVIMPLAEARTGLCVPVIFEDAERVVSAKSEGSSGPQKRKGLLVCINKQGKEFSAADAGEADCDNMLTLPHPWIAEQLGTSLGAVLERAGRELAARQTLLRQWLRVWASEVKASVAARNLESLQVVEASTEPLLGAKDASDLCSIVAAAAAECSEASKGGLFLLAAGGQSVLALDDLGCRHTLAASASAILAHTFATGEGMSLGDAGADEVLRVLGAAEGSAAMTEIVRDESGEVAAVIAVAGSPRRAVFGVGHRDRLGLLAARVATALHHERWQKLQALAGTRIHGRMTGEAAHHKGALDWGGGGDGGWEGEEGVWRKPEEMLESFEKMVKEVMGCAASKVYVSRGAWEGVGSQAAAAGPGWDVDELSTVSREITGPQIVQVDAIGIAGLVKHQGVEIVIDDASHDDRYDAATDIAIGNVKTPTLIAVPIVHPRSKVLLGVLQVVMKGKEAEGVEGVEELRAIARGAATHMALGLDNNAAVWELLRGGSPDPTVLGSEMGSRPQSGATRDAAAMRSSSRRGSA